MTTEKNILDTGKSLRDGMVHFVLSHSYTVFFAAVVLGLALDIYSPVSLFSHASYSYIGAFSIIFGSVIIWWAQKTSSCSQKDMDKGLSERDFERGPYKYSRNPTHIGLTIMTLGLALILNSFFSVLLLIIASVLTKFVFLRKQEALLEKRYGQAYCDYKKKVSTWV